jgi:hypothetical protein
MFFIKKKKIVVDAFTSNQSVHDFFPIQTAVNFIPDWWKQIPSTYESTNKFGLKLKQPTLKRCDGFLHLYRKGFIIPLWSDLIIETKETGQWFYSWSDLNGNNIIDHEREQIGNSLPHMIHIKITSPWAIREKTGVEFHWTDPMWNKLEKLSKISVLPGVVNFKYQNTNHINCFLPAENNRYEISNGQPMAHCIPLSDSDVEIKTHMVSNEEFINMRLLDTQRFSFLNFYKNKVKIIDKKEKKCPFGFGK